MDVQVERYLRPTYVIDCKHTAIVEKSKELTEQFEDDIQKAISLFYFVRDKIKYNLYVPKYSADHFKASNTLASGEGYCVQKAVLLDALARAAGIPAALGFARLVNHLLPEKIANWLGGNILPFHGYSELYLGGKWIKATPSFDLEMSERHGFIPSAFNGRNDAWYPSHNREGKPHIEYVHHYGHLYDDLPLQQLWDNVIKFAGKQVLDPQGEIDHLASLG